MTMRRLLFYVTVTVLIGLCLAVKAALCSL
jgi:hypothetical protein